MGRKNTDQRQKAKAKPKSDGRNGTEKSQSERFIEAARAIGVDESGEEFERALKKVAPPKRQSRSHTE